MVGDRAFLFHIYVPWGKTISLAPKSRSPVKVKLKCQGHSFRKKKKKWPLRRHLCFTNTSCSCYFTVECKPECSECSPSSPNNCTICTNKQLYVQDGRCVHTCRMGFYPSPSRMCMPCHETCYTCISGTQYHCDMCQPGLMWKHGECVTQCGSGYYLQNGKCLRKFL